MTRRWLHTLGMVLLTAVGIVPLLADSPLRKTGGHEEYRGTEEARPEAGGFRLHKAALTFDAGVLLGNESEKRDPEVDVRGVYTVTSSAETKASFEFATTVPVRPRVAVNGNPAVVEGGEISSDKEERSGDIEDGSRLVWRFSGRLVPGPNRIEIAYAHPLGFSWHKKRLWSYRFLHHLEPLRGWTLDPEFAMDVRVRFRDETTWRKRLFRGPADRRRARSVRVLGKSRSVGKDYAFLPLQVSTSEPSEGLVEASFSLGRDFPQVLWVIMVDEGILPTTGYPPRDWVAEASASKPRNEPPPSRP